MLHSGSERKFLINLKNISPMTAYCNKNAVNQQIFTKCLGMV